MGRLIYRCCPRSATDYRALSLMGLAYPSISNIGQAPFFNHAIVHGAVSSPMFGFKLASTDSELYLGGTNEALYLGSLETHAVDTSTGRYSFNPSGHSPSFYS
jgi:Eukaryotic aspartyl protease